MTWIRLDPQEIGNTGAHLRDVSAALIDSAARVRAACCQPGLGRHAGPLMAEGDSLSTRTISLTEGYLRLGIDILQRAIAAVQDNQLVSSLGGIGSVSASVIGGSTVGGFVLGEASSVSTAVIGGSTVGGFVLGAVSPVSTAVIGGTTVGGFVIDSPSSIGASVIGGTTGYFHGGGNWGSGVMALAGAAQNSQERQDAIMARLRASGGGGTGSGGLGNQMLANMNNAAALKRLDETQIKIAASQPFAGIVQAEAADKIDFGGRARAIENDRYYEKKRLQGL